MKCKVIPGELPCTSLAKFPLTWPPQSFPANFIHRVSVNGSCACAYIQFLSVGGLSSVGRSVMVDGKNTRGAGGDTSNGGESGRSGSGSCGGSEGFRASGADGDAGEGGDGGRGGGNTCSRIEGVGVDIRSDARCVGGVAAGGDAINRGDSGQGRSCTCVEDEGEASSTRGGGRGGGVACG